MAPNKITVVVVMNLVWFIVSTIGKPFTTEEIVVQNVAMQTKVILKAIYFDTSATTQVFINGQKLPRNKPWTNAHPVIRNLWYGDVISIIAKPRDGHMGVLVTTRIGNETESTGIDLWRAREAFESGKSGKAWMRRGYNVCDWPNAVEKQVTKVPANFRGDDDARFVWAPATNSKSRVFLRYRIGGDACYNTNGQQHFMTAVEFSSTGRALLYINGILASESTRARSHVTVRRPLGAGDVIALVVTSRENRSDAIVSIKRAFLDSVTGGAGWHAVGATTVQSSGNVWMLNSFNGCTWPIAKKLPRLKRSISFPYDGTAAYVTARRSKLCEMVFLRHEIQGESCS